MANPTVISQQVLRTKTAQLDIAAGPTNPNSPLTFDVEFPASALFVSGQVDYWDPAVAPPVHVLVPLRGLGGKSWNDGTVKFNAVGSISAPIRHIQIDLENLVARPLKCVISVDYSPF